MSEATGGTGAASGSDEVGPHHEGVTHHEGFSGRAVLDELMPEVAELRRRIPEVWSAYAGLHRAALGDGALPARTKELIALAVAITRTCDGCIASHARGAARRGASEAEVAEAIGVAVLMNGGPATVYGPRAFSAFREAQAAVSAPGAADHSART